MTTLGASKSRRPRQAKRLLAFKKLARDERKCQKNEETANIADDKETTEGLDFQEDQVKIIPLPSSQAIRVLAERPHASNRRSWFSQDFPVPENCNVNKTQAPIRPNLSVGEEGGQEKSTTSQFSEKATTQPNPREGIEEPASIKIEKKPLYRKILRPHKKEEEEVINEESEVEDSEALSPLKDKSKPIAQKGEDEAP
uniref:Uncharacterized protein n=1 Tax=Populus trichocarpa TaxID=3694 RepID=B9HVH0_POPTR